MSLQQTALQQTWLSTNLPETASTSVATNSDTRRMSEPCHTLTDRKSPPPRPASVTLSPLKASDIHPNQAVVLDEVEEGEMVENKLVIPDEMVHYLNQVADTNNGDFSGMQWAENGNSDQKPLASPSQPQMLPSPNPSLGQMLNSPASSAFNNILPSPRNALSPSAIMPSPRGLNQMVPSPAGNMNQMMPSPSNMSQMMPSPAANMSQMMPSPAPNMNQMIPSPATNIPQMMASPAPPNFNQVMPSPSSNFGGLQNPIMSPAPSMNQMVASPGSHMVQSPMSVRCHSQMLSPNVNQSNGMVQTPHPMHSPQNPQNCNVMQQNQMMQNGGMMVQNQCYGNRAMPMNHSNGMCYVQHGNWESNVPMAQNRMCQNNAQVLPQNDHHSMCHSRNTNIDFNQCRSQMPMTNAYMNNALPNNPANQCNNHNYQMCNNSTAYAPNNCHQPKHPNGYQCNNTAFPPMPSPGYGCVPNMSEPLASPAMATPAPNDAVNQLQQAQMSRPCPHYGQNCFRYNNQCLPNLNSMGNQQQQCSCQKPAAFAQAPNNKCYHQCNSNEIQCKDISQSQLSPGIVNQQTNSGNAPQKVNSGSAVQPLGMRQDAYQRTLEYVQNCQSWVGNSEMVSSTTNPVVKCGDAASSNMIVNDMTSSLSSLLEENRYLQLIQ